MSNEDATFTAALRILADNMRSARQAAGQSQAETAQRSGVTQCSISRIENLKANPNLRKLARLATAIGCGVADFWKDDPSH